MIIIWSKDTCAYCEMAKRLLNQNGLAFEEKKIGYDYTKEEAYFPLDYIRKNKFNVPISLVQDALGDRILILKD